MNITYNIIDPNPDGEKTIITAPFRTKWLWSEELVELRDLVDYGSDYVLVTKARFCFRLTKRSARMVRLTQRQ